MNLDLLPTDPSPAPPLEAARREADRLWTAYEDLRVAEHRTEQTVLRALSAAVAARDKVAEIEAEQLRAAK